MSASLCIKPWMTTAVFLVILWQTCAGFENSGLSSASQKWWYDLYDSGMPSLGAFEVNVTTVVGHTVSLPCRVRNLNSKTVSWIRSRDLTVIAVDRHTITTDSRFSVKHPEDSDDWVLEIQSVQPHDAGTYDCQINTYPKISTSINLMVIARSKDVSLLDQPVSDIGSPKNFSDLEVILLGSPSVEVPQGHPLHLACKARGTVLTDDAFGALNGRSPIQWTLNDENPLTNLFPHNRVKIIETWKSPSEVESELLLSETKPEDSGKYCCSVLESEEAAFFVSILKARQSTANLVTASEFLDDASAPKGGTVSGTATRIVVFKGIILLLLFLAQFAICLFYSKKT